MRPAVEDAEDFSGWIGRTEAAQPEALTPRLIDGFSATLGDALADVDGAPLGLHWCLAPPAAAPQALGPDGHPAKGGFLPPVPLPRRMWASGKVSFHQPMRPGDMVRKTSRITSVSWKSGASGRLCFVTVGHSYAGAAGLLISEDQVIVYRAAPDGPASPAEPKLCTKSFDLRRAVPVDTVRLFRYSALTFNAHRIHYDQAYAREVEFYPDVVIHGPLQATFLLNFAASTRRGTPHSFSYRGVAPATGVQTLQLGLQELDSSTCALSVAAENGSETMTGEAHW